MPIATTSPPQSAVSIVQTAIIEGLAKSSFTLPRLSRASPKSLALAFPHQVAFLPLATIRSYAKLRVIAVDAGWRFLVQQKTIADRAVQDGYSPIASVTVTDIGDGKFEVAEFNEGPFVQGTETAVRFAENLDEVRKGQFEPVVLFAPAVYVVALWLKNRASDDDILIPITPSDAALAPLRPTTPTAFLTVLHKLAKDLRVGSGTP